METQSDLKAPYPEHIARAIVAVRKSLQAGGAEDSLITVLYVLKVAERSLFKILEKKYSVADWREIEQECEGNAAFMYEDYKEFLKKIEESN